MTDNGGPAFPVPASFDQASGYHIRAQGGMSLRDWFAGQVLASNIPEAAFSGATEKGIAAVEAARIAAGTAYALADAMLNMREQ